MRSGHARLREGRANHEARSCGVPVHGPGRWRMDGGERGARRAAGGPTHPRPARDARRRRLGGLRWPRRLRRHPLPAPHLRAGALDPARARARRGPRPAPQRARPRRDAAQRRAPDHRHLGPAQRAGDRGRCRAGQLRRASGRGFRRTGPRLRHVARIGRCRGDRGRRRDAAAARRELLPEPAHEDRPQHRGPGSRRGGPRAASPARDQPGAQRDRRPARDPRRDAARPFGAREPPRRDPAAGLAAQP